MDEADGFDGPELAELALQLLLGRVKAQPPHEQRLERVALRSSSLGVALPMASALLPLHAGASTE